MYKKTVLKNGINLVNVPIKNIDTTTTLFLFPVGSRYEKKNLNGISHFIEHLMFKGTAKRPTSLDITREFDKIGAQYNAFTGKDQTGYWVKTTNKKTKIAFEVLSDMTFNSVFDKQEIEREKGVICEEIKMFEENPLFYADDFFERGLYGDHSLGRFVAGDEKKVRGITQKDLENYWYKFYQPNNLVLTVSGGISYQESKKIAQKYLGEIKSRKNKNNYFSFKESDQNKKSSVEILYKNLAQAQVMLGGIAYPHNHPKINFLRLLMVILGGNMSSRLFSEIREKRGLAYSVYARNYCYQDTGHYLISAGVDKKRVFETVKVILDELKKIKKYGIDNQELKIAKDYLIGTTKLALEDSAKVASFYGGQLLLTKKIETLEQKFKKIKEITKEDIEKTAKNIFNKVHLSIIGPFKNKEKLLRILGKGL